MLLYTKFHTKQEQIYITPHDLLLVLYFSWRFQSKHAGEQIGISFHNDMASVISIIGYLRR